jgi:hypothetical protein
MITASAVKAPSVVMDCRDKPGNDRAGSLEQNPISSARNQNLVMPAQAGIQ